MGLFNFLFNKNKSQFKQTEKSLENNNIDDNINTIETEEYTANLKLLQAAREYTELKKELIERGISIDVETDPYRATLTINDLIHSTLEQIPPGIIIPIHTSFTKDGATQTLILGRDIISSSQFVKKTGNKPKHGILRHKYIALMIDYEKAPNIFNPGITNRITIENEHSVYLINLLTEDFLESQTQTCRFSNVEFNFTDWENSLDQIRNIGQTPYSIDLLKTLPVLDMEITEEISSYLEERSKEMKEELNKISNDENID